MWPWVFTFVKVRRGRKAAVAIISPMVEQSRRRLNEIPELAWLDPYMIGFIVMLITVVAKNECDLHDSYVLGLVQSEAWAEITGLEGDLVGEEVVLLDAAGNPGFQAGCRNAVSYGAALYQAETYPDQFGAGYDDLAAQTDRSVILHAPANETWEYENTLTSLWTSFFDTHVAGLRLGQA